MVYTSADASFKVTFDFTDVTQSLTNAQSFTVDVAAAERDLGPPLADGGLSAGVRGGGMTP